MGGAVVHPTIERLFEVLGRAGETDWSVLPPDELGRAVLDWEAARARFDSVSLAMVGAFDRSGAWADDGSRSAKGWITRHSKVSPGAAARLVVRSRHHRAMPLVAAALAAGEITLDHVAVLGRARTPERVEVFARAEAFLVAKAKELGFDDFTRAVAYWCQVVDADGEEDKRDRQMMGRGLHLSKTIDGMRVLDARFDPVGGAIVEQELQRLEQEEFDADWAEAKAVHGDATNVSHLARTPAQRRADAAVRMAQRSASLTEGSELARPLVYLHVDVVTFLVELVEAMRSGAIPDAEIPELAGIDADEVAELLDRSMGAGNRPGPRMCELADGTAVLPSEIIPLALRADVRRVVFGPRGNVLNFGRKERLFKGALREAIMVRDRSCTEDGACGRAGHRCQVDHVIPWDAGGPTDEANGRLMCGPANRHRHRNRSRRTA
jgi:hypothetical protein